MSTLPKYDRSNTIVRFYSRRPIKQGNSLYVTIPFQFSRAHGIDENTVLCLLWDKDNKQLIVYKNSQQPKDD